MKLSVLFVVAAAFVLWCGPALACTVISAGKLATTDGSVITSHTCDSHRTGSDVDKIPARVYRGKQMLPLTKRMEDNSGPMERYARQPVGEIAQVSETHGYLAPAYASMNEYQLAIGESTFEGRLELQSEEGLIDCETLTRLILERARTAREALDVMDNLLTEHGWNDVGETLTFADPNEVWHVEILGPGKEKKGAVWAARRIPDGHVSVVANGSRLRRLDLNDKDSFRASANVFKLAEDNGWWDPKSGKPFEFCYAYAPTSRTSVSCTRREWRVFDTVAPSLKLNPNSNDYPFSVAPDKKITALTVMELFRDTFEGTDFDMCKNITVTDEKSGKTVKSPLANPFMPYDMNPLFKINGGWGWRGERPMARWYCMYATVTQSRGWLPHPVGGIVWFAYDNPAMTTYVPFYVGMTDLPKPYKIDGRTTGFSREAAWWAFNRLATLTAQRWGEMRLDVAAVRDPVQEEMFTLVRKLDKQAGALYGKNPGKARALLTREVSKAAVKVVEMYWKLGDLIWTKYDEKW